MVVCDAIYRRDAFLLGTGGIMLSHFTRLALGSRRGDDTEGYIRVHVLMVHCLNIAFVLWHVAALGRRHCYTSHCTLGGADP